MKLSKMNKHLVFQYWYVNESDDVNTHCAHVFPTNMFSFSFLYISLLPKYLGGLFVLGCIEASKQASKVERSLSTFK